MKLTLELDLDNPVYAANELRRVASLLDPGDLLTPDTHATTDIEHSTEPLPPGSVTTTPAPASTAPPASTPVPKSVPVPQTIPSANDWPEDQRSRDAMFLDLARQLGSDINEAGDLIRAQGATRLRELDDRTQHAVWLQLNALVAAHD